MNLSQQLFPHREGRFHALAVPLLCARCDEKGCKENKVLVLRAFDVAYFADCLDHLPRSSAVASDDKYRRFFFGASCCVDGPADADG